MSSSKMVINDKLLGLDTSKLPELIANGADTDLDAFTAAIEVMMMTEKMMENGDGDGDGDVDDDDDDGGRVDDDWGKDILNFFTQMVEIWRSRHHPQQDGRLR
eukprot:755251-Hanusia_phi.AAC.2